MLQCRESSTSLRMLLTVVAPSVSVTSARTVHPPIPSSRAGCTTMIYSDAYAVVAASATESSLEKSAQLDGHNGRRSGGVSPRPRLRLKRQRLRNRYWPARHRSKTNSPLLVCKTHRDTPSPDLYLSAVWPVRVLTRRAPQVGSVMATARTVPAPHARCNCTLVVAPALQWSTRTDRRLTGDP